MVVFGIVIFVCRVLHAAGLRSMVVVCAQWAGLSAVSRGASARFHGKATDGVFLIRAWKNHLAVMKVISFLIM